jgi:hypothetical protein
MSDAGPRDHEWPAAWAAYVAAHRAFELHKGRGLYAASKRQAKLKTLEAAVARLREINPDRCRGILTGKKMADNPPN